MLKQIETAVGEAFLLLAALKSVPRWQREAEARLAERLKTLVAAAGRTMLARLETSGIPTSDIPRAQMVAAFDEIEGPAIEAIQDAAAEAAQHGRAREVDALRKQGIKIPEAGKTAKAIEQALREQAFIASERTLARMRGEVMARLADAYDQGLGINDAARGLRETFTDMADWEMRRIARTEIQSAQSDAAHMTLDEFGAEYRQWITADDDRVRDRHLDMHEVIVRAGTPYPNGLMHPGDRSGPLDEWINCRCREIPYILSPGERPPIGKNFFFPGEITS